jgi:hypothetical protein
VRHGDGRLIWVEGRARIRCGEDGTPLLETTAALARPGQAEDRIHARESGFDEHLVKPAEAAPAGARRKLVNGAVGVRHATIGVPARQAIHARTHAAGTIPAARPFWHAPVPERHGPDRGLVGRIGMTPGTRANDWPRR